MSDYAEILRGALQRGDSLDASLAVLREQGATLLESIKAVREVKSVDLGEAKRVVHFSPAWEDRREAQDVLIDGILAALDDLPTSSAPAPTPPKD